MKKNFTIKVRLFSHLKDKAGTNALDLDINPDTTIAELKNILTHKFPVLETHLDNILIMIDNKVGINEDIIPDSSTITFMTPIGGG